MSLLYNNNKCPQSCKNCVPPERHIGCHSDCEKYQKAVKEWNDYKTDIYEKSKDDFAYRKFKNTTIKATIKKLRK